MDFKILKNKKDIKATLKNKTDKKLIKFKYNIDIL